MNSRPSTAAVDASHDDDDLLSFEDEASSQGDSGELVEFATRVRSDGRVEVNFESRPASGDEQAEFAGKQRIGNNGPAEAAVTKCSRWMNTFTLGPIVSREVDMAAARSGLPQNTPETAPLAAAAADDRKEHQDERRQMLSFEEEPSSREDQTLLEMVSRVRTDNFFELKSEHHPASEAEAAEIEVMKRSGAYHRVWHHNLQLGDLLRRNMVSRNAAGDELLSPCSSIDFATILRDLQDDHNASLMDDDGPVRARSEDRHQSRNMAIVLLSRCNPQSLIRNSGPKRKGTPTSPPPGPQ